MRNYAVFILSHGRAESISTVRMLENGNYTGEWFVVIDDEDEEANLYYEKFGEHVIQFCKKEIAEKTDTCDMDDDRRVGVFARNFIIDEAKRRGYKYHLQLDDDFNSIDYRYIVKDKLKAKKCTQFDKLFDAFAEYLESADITWLSFGVSSFYMGGVNPNVEAGLIRKTVCSFFINTYKTPYFFCRMNDDITTNAVWTSRGRIMFSVMPVQMEMKGTQQVDGGMTEIYKENGTYRKSYYTVMAAPSFSIIACQGVRDMRLHHEIRWDYCAPKILNESLKK